MRKQIRRSGAEGSRTLDLLNAIQALSQLSYRPGFVEINEFRTVAVLCFGVKRINFPRRFRRTSMVDFDGRSSVACHHGNPSTSALYYRPRLSRLQAELS